jgi:hypothetical protein
MNKTDNPDMVEGQETASDEDAAAQETLRGAMKAVAGGAKR